MPCAFASSRRPSSQRRSRLASSPAGYMGLTSRFRRTEPTHSYSSRYQLPTSPNKENPLLEVSDLRTVFALRGSLLQRTLGRTTPLIHAVDGVNFNLNKGEVFGVVGESGSGKSTLARTLLGLVPPTS